MKYCDVPAIGTYSNIDYATLHYQSTANYACDDGFVSSADKLTTELTSTCQDDKTWNPGPLNCTRTYYIFYNKIVTSFNLNNDYTS